MPQRFSLDRGRARSYYAAIVLVGFLAACRSAPAPLVPAGMPPLAVGTVAGWARAVRPAQPTRYDLRWRFTTQQGSAAGRAVVRYQAPDTLRFDYRAPLGRSGAALFVGQEAVWAQPADELRAMVPAALLFWAGMGLPLDPPAGALVTGLERDGTRSWRQADAGDALDVVWRAVPGIQAFTPPPGYALAMKMAAARSPLGAREVDDIRFLLRSMNLTTAPAALAVVTRYFAERYLPSEAPALLSRLLSE